MRTVSDESQSDLRDTERRLDEGGADPSADDGNFGEGWEAGYSHGYEDGYAHGSAGKPSQADASAARHRHAKRTVASPQTQAETPTPHR
jgi:hypothetical protein